MRYAGQLRTRAPLALLASLGLFGLALCVMAPAGRAADTPSTPAADTNVRITAFPPAIHVDTVAAAKDDAAAPPSEGKRGPHLRFDTDDDFDEFSNQVQKMTHGWVIGLVFLIVGSIFLTPVVLLVGIIWYKLRKTRLQNEAMLALAERGIIPPAQAADALAAGTPPSSAAPQVYQQAVATRKKVVWSDLRKGVILSMAGLALSFYDLISSGGPNSVGLVLLFVGAGYVVLWWLEGRHLDEAKAKAADNGGKSEASGG
jgi:hypothetical protein